MLCLLFCFDITQSMRKNSILLEIDKLVVDSVKFSEDTAIFRMKRDIQDDECDRIIIEMKECRKK